ncbi:MAG: prepilin-type N-terminal cleavage/methylation domain-containing protein [bacterium]
MINKKKGNRGFTLIELMIVIAIIAILAAILVPNFMKARAQGQLTACQSNLKNIGTALEMYSTDNSGRYFTGTALTPLQTGEYLKTIPTCPANAATVAYGYASSAGPDMFTVNCGGGAAHGGLAGGAGYPQYTASGGLNNGK